MKKKLRLFILLGCLFSMSFLLYLPAAGANEGIHTNGYDWQKWTTSEKLSFVEGWVKCGKAAWDNLPLYTDKLDESIEYANFIRKVFSDEGVLLGGVTIGQIIDTISEIYSDPRTKMVEIVDIMPFVSGRLVYGWTLQQLDEVIAVTVKLDRCEQEYKKNQEYLAECGSLRVGKNSVLQKLRKK